MFRACRIFWIRFMACRVARSFRFQCLGLEHLGFDQRLRLVGSGKIGCPVWAPNEHTHVQWFFLQVWYRVRPLLS